MSYSKGGVNINNSAIMYKDSNTPQPNYANYFADIGGTNIMSTITTKANDINTSYNSYFYSGYVRPTPTNYYINGDDLASFCLTAYREYTSSATNQTIPSWCSKVWVIAVGGGGGGGGGGGEGSGNADGNYSYTGNHGYPGSLLVTTKITVVPNSTYSVAIGGGGSGGAGGAGGIYMGEIGSPGNPPGAPTVITFTTQTLTANGGAGGAGGAKSPNDQNAVESGIRNIISNQNYYGKGIGGAGGSTPTYNPDTFSYAPGGNGDGGASGYARIFFYV